MLIFFSMKPAAIKKVSTKERRKPSKERREAEIWKKTHRRGNIEGETSKQNDIERKTSTGKYWTLSIALYRCLTFDISYLLLIIDRRASQWKGAIEKSRQNSHWKGGEPLKKRRQSLREKTAKERKPSKKVYEREPSKKRKEPTKARRQWSAKEDHLRERRTIK